MRHLRLEEVGMMKGKGEGKGEGRKAMSRDRIWKSKAGGGGRAWGGGREIKYVE
jgi:hypothetical protein